MPIYKLNEIHRKEIISKIISGIKYEDIAREYQVTQGTVARIYKDVEIDDLKQLHKLFRNLNRASKKLIPKIDSNTDPCYKNIVLQEINSLKEVLQEIERKLK